MKCDLINVFNHQYEKNIGLLDHYYSGKFNKIWHLSPFSKSTLEHVIPVYDGSFTFQNFIANAWHHIKHSDADYFVFVSDDLILDPAVNQTNIDHHFSLGADGAFISVLHDLSRGEYGRGLKEVKRMQKQSHLGLEYERHLPSVQEATKLISRHVTIDTLKLSKYPSYNAKMAKPYLENFRKNWKNTKANIWHQRERWRHHLNPAFMPYPVIGGNADIFIMPRSRMPEFIHLCGVFSAMRVFVELAVPTAMAMTCEKISTEENTARTGINYVKVWQQQEIKFARMVLQKVEQDCDLKLNNLASNWPHDYLYLHPLKLSKWSYL